MVHIGFSGLVDLSENALEDFVVDLWEDGVSTDVIAPQEIVDGTFFEFVQAVNNLFSDDLYVVEFVGLHIEGIHLVQINADGHYVLDLHQVDLIRDGAQSVLANSALSFSEFTLDCQDVHNEV